MKLFGCIAAALMFGGLAMLVGPVRGDTTADTMPSYPPPEPYMAQGDYAGYRTSVLQFLDKKATAPEAPRAAMDLLQYSSVIESEPNTALRMYATLLMDYTPSYQTKYLMSQLRDPSEFTRMMYGIFLANAQNIPPEFPRKFVRATRAGLTRFPEGRSLLAGGQELVAFTAIMAHRAGDGDLQDTLQNVLKQLGPQGEAGLAIVQTMTDDHKTPVEQLTALHQVTPHGGVIIFERMLSNQLKDADRDLPTVQKILADDDVMEGRLTDALTKLDKLPADMLDARLSFWRGWATAVKGDSARAAHILRDLAKQSPNDPWGKLAGEAAVDVEGQAENLAAATDSLFNAMTPFHNKIHGLEMHSQFDVPKGPPVHLYLGIIAKQNMELFATQGDVVKVAYHSTEKDSSVYFADENKKWVFNSGGILAVPTIQWTGTQLSLSTSPSWLDTPDDVLTTIGKLAQLPFVASRGGVTDWMDSFVKQGTLPGRVQVDGTVKTFKWIHPDPLEAKLVTTSYSIDSKTSAMTFSRGEFKITSLRVVGDDQELTLSAPVMPNVPEANTVHADKVDREVTARVFGAIQRTVSPPTTKPSTQP